MIDWMAYLKEGVAHGASDVFFVAGGCVCEKVDGHLCQLESGRLLPQDTQQIVEEVYCSAKREMDHFLQTGDDDFSFSVPGLARFRVNTYRQRGSMSAVIRIVSFDIPDWQAIGIPESVMGSACSNGTQHHILLPTVFAQQDHGSREVQGIIRNTLSDSQLVECFY